MTFTLWFTGLPSSGKSTIAKRVEDQLRNQGMDLHNLDGDDIRGNLHPDLGFTEEERAINNRRVAFIASLLNQHDIGVIVAAISPFKDARAKAEDIIDDHGEFIEIHVDCPIDVCKERDPKNLYEQAEAGKIDNFTGVNHPYEDPDHPDITINTAEDNIEACVTQVMEALESQGYLSERDEYTGLSTKDEETIKNRLRNLGYLD